MTAGGRGGLADARVGDTVMVELDRGDGRRVRVAGTVIRKDAAYGGSLVLTTVDIPPIAVPSADGRAGVSSPERVAGGDR